MSDAANSPPQLAPWARAHLDAYLRSGGTEGHMFDFRPINGAGIMPNCLIKHVGRKSGRTRILPLIYGMADGEIVLVASKGGAPTHPAWYFNVTAAQHVDVQIATQAYRATWREPEGEERTTIWNAMVSIYPPYAPYQESTDRLIPILLLKPVADVPIFSEADMAD